MIRLLVPSSLLLLLLTACASAQERYEPAQQVDRSQERYQQPYVH